jgi:hypothetical protein
MIEVRLQSRVPKVEVEELVEELHTVPRQFPPQAQQAGVQGLHKWEVYLQVAFLSSSQQEAQVCP